MDDLINYSDSTDFEPKRWNQRSFKNYFIETYRKVHHAGGAIPWGIKEDIMLSRMFTSYTSDDVANMILYWHTNIPQSAIACQFGNLYGRRIEIYHAMKKATSDYTWEN